MRPALFALALLAAACSASEGHPDPLPPDEVDAGVDAGGEPGDAGGPTACTAYGQPSQVGAVKSAAIPELSGIAFSRKNPAVVFVHNDSGDTARFFALRTDGSQLAEFTVTGATATDWEDLDVGPCPAGTCVFLGDIGDNNAARKDYTVYRVPEPEVTGPQGTSAVTATAFKFKYPDGAHNAETLLVHPVTGAVYVVTKKAGSAGVYRLPTFDATATVTLEKIADLAYASQDTLTAGAIHPTGERVLLRGYFSALEYRGAPGEALEQLLAHTPLEVPLANEAQGEAVCYRPDGLGYLTASEGLNEPIWQIRCR